MPTYEYECKSCSHTFEVFQSMSDPPLKDCPKCGREVRRLIFGGTGVIFKGSGFYVTDKNKSPPKTGSKDAGKAETKPASSGQGADSAAKGDSATTDSPAVTPKSPAEKAKPESKSA